jgi:hypothetical protein
MMRTNHIPPQKRGEREEGEREGEWRGRRRREEGGGRREEGGGRREHKKERRIQKKFIISLSSFQIECWS